MNNINFLCLAPTTIEILKGKPVFHVFMTHFMFLEQRKDFNFIGTLRSSSSSDKNVIFIGKSVFINIVRIWTLGKRYADEFRHI